MLSIARLAMKGPLAAALSATVYTLLALIFAPFLFVAGGIICIAVVRRAVAADQALSAGQFRGQPCAPGFQLPRRDFPG